MTTPTAGTVPRKLPTRPAPDLCRVVVVTPNGPVEMALPAEVPVCDLLPTLVHQATTAAGGPGAHDDWVLQRFGEAPLDEEQTPAALKIRHGETLHLRPRDDQLPVVHFDDLIDGVATGIRNRRDRWRDWMTRRTLLIIAGLTLTLGLALLVGGSLNNPPLAAAGVAGGIALLLAGAAAVSSRAFGESAAGILLAAAAVPYAGLAGLSLPAVPGASLLAAPNLLAGAVAAALAATIAAVAVGEAGPAFLALALASLAAAAGGSLGTVAGLPATGAAALVVVIALTLATCIPSLSFWLAKLRLPALPTGAEDLAADVEPHAVTLLLDRAAVADRYMTALFAAVGAITAGCLIFLAPAGGWPALSLSVAICGVLALRARSMDSAWQRTSALGPALLGAALVVEHLGDSPVFAVRAGWVAVVLTTALVTVSLARVVPGRTLVPYWGRAGDILEWVVAIALIPLSLAVLDVYGFVRALAG
jgi:type VII secretion integral membrane protein EccD